MVVAAPRIDIRVARFVRRCERHTPVIAAVSRATGVYCDRIGLTRPSYESVRLLVHESRDRRDRRRAAAKLVDVNFRVRPPHDLLYLFDDPRDAPRR